MDGGHDDGDGRRDALMICWACAFLLSMDMI